MKNLVNIIETRKILKNKKRNNFNKFIEGINKNVSLSYVWKKMKILKNKNCVVNWNEWKNKNRKEEIKK